MNPLANIKPVKFDGVTAQFIEVTPVIAADWLKRNTKNRRLKDLTVEAYALDIKNGAWFTTHQGIAFNDDGALIDGQHRLQAIVRAKRAVTMFVTCGWPSEAKKKTMDAVDRGCNRSLADQLHLQHGFPVKEAQRVVQISNQMGAICFGNSRVRRATTNTVVDTVALFRDEIKWIIGDESRERGVTKATVLACLVLARGQWPDKVSDFWLRLRTGENLSRENPVLHLRNYLIGNGQYDSADVVRNATLYHLCCFVEDKKLSSLVTNSNIGLIKLLTLQKPRVEKVCAIYNQPPPVFLRPNVDVSEAPESNKGVTPTSAEGIKIGESLRDPFSTLDMSARLDEKNHAGRWLGVWLQKKWIETVGVGQFRKTATFGK